MIQVIIPYYAAGAQGNELAYAVAGWRKHFKEAFHITVVGDWHSVVETGTDISFIECPQVPDPGPENYRPHIDHVRKFRKALETMPGIDGFIYACDDMYAVNDFDIHDVRVLKKLSDSIQGNANSSNGWQRDAFRTQERLLSEGYPTVNYVCHLPVYYELDKLLAIWDQYDCDHVSYIVEDLYFNNWFCRRRALWVKAPSDPFKMGIYKPTPAAVIRGAMARKIWITNSPDGWSAELAALLEEHYQFYL